MWMYTSLHSHTRIAPYDQTRRAVDPEAAAELDEKEALARAQERMSLRHKNTSKWAKHAQRTQGATAQVCGLSFVYIERVVVFVDWDTAARLNSHATKSSYHHFCYVGRDAARAGGAAGAGAAAAEEGRGGGQRRQRGLGGALIMSMIIWMYV